jgi:hypothetical protein
MNSKGQYQTAIGIRDKLEDKLDLLRGKIDLSRELKLIDAADRADRISDRLRDIMARDEIEPTDELTAILNKLWNGPAIDAASLLRKLADGMEQLHRENDGSNFAPDLIHAIQQSDVYKEWIIKETS